MGRKSRKSTMSGLHKRNDIWWMEKMVDGQRIRESTGTRDRAEAERYVIHRLEELRIAKVYGVRPKRLFREAAIKFLKEHQHKRSYLDDVCQIKLLDSYIGELFLEQVHMGNLQSYIEDRRKQDVKNRTINKALQVVRHILNLAASEWLDEYGLTWLLNAPKIKLLSENDRSPPYPLSWEQQDDFFAQLPLYLRRMALFKVNTGCRDQEVCGLKWEWEIPVIDLNTSVFVIPGKHTKNGLDRLVVLNNIAKQVIDEVREEHAVYVFTCARWGNRIIEEINNNAKIPFERRRLFQMNNNSWQKARVEVGLPHLRVHDLKHTFGRGLRSAGVSFEDRQDLLGHKSAKITTHYSVAEIKNLIDAANRVCQRTESTSVLALLKRNKVTNVGEDAKLFPSHTNWERVSHCKG